jgi:hypothetical protein
MKALAEGSRPARRCIKTRQKGVLAEPFQTDRGELDTYVFGNNFLQRLRKQRPEKDFQVLLDVTRFRIREVHDTLEEAVDARSVFGNCNRVQTLQISPDTVLLHDRKFLTDQLLKKMDDIDGGDEVIIDIFTINARHDVVGRAILVRHDAATRDDEPVPVLNAAETDKASTGLGFGGVPITTDVCQRRNKLQSGQHVSWSISHSTSE